MPGLVAEPIGAQPVAALSNPAQAVRHGIGGRRARSALQIIAGGPNEIDAFAASEALEEMDYYDSEVARVTPLFDETAAKDDEWDERSGWEEDAEEDADDDLGEYA